MNWHWHFEHLKIKLGGGEFTRFNDFHVGRVLGCGTMGQ
jgi:hypothetical protein